MYRFYGRYDGLAKSSYKRILIALPITIFYLFLFLGVCFYLLEEIIDVSSSDYSFLINLVSYPFTATLALWVTRETMLSLTHTRFTPPELRIFEDEKFAYKKFDKQGNVVETFEFYNRDIKAIENENKSLMIETDDGKKYVLFKQYNATERTFKLLQQNYKNEFYTILMKWFELHYNKKEERLELHHCYITDMDKKGAFEIGSVKLF